MLPETMLFFLYIGLLLKTVITGKHYEYFREVMSIDNGVSEGVLNVLHRYYRHIGSLSWQNQACTYSVLD